MYVYKTAIQNIALIELPFLVDGATCEYLL